jgi:Beta-ketoacyl synthase, N-terminal domain
MIEFSIRAWSAWAPGVERADDWRRWAEKPFALSTEGTPQLPSIPPMQRRRFSRVSRMALHVALDALPPEGSREISTVFASRHGEATASIALLQDIAKSLPLSPTTFSHSVHNTAAGLFSIATASARASSSIAAVHDTLGCGLVEALGSCERQRRPTLLVIADEPTVEIFSAFADEIPAAFALALLVEDESTGGGERFGFELADPTPHTIEPALPHALSFLAWMLGSSDALVLPGDRRDWKFQRLR